MDDRLIWVDLEMTGLNHEEDTVIEIACIITDGELNIIAAGPDIVIHQPQTVMESMGDWCKEHHGKSGLTKAVEESKFSLQEAEDAVVAFVQKHTKRGKCPLAGNSIHTDKNFLEKYMPKLIDHLHYRMVDVSTVKELCRRWFPLEYSKCPEKKELHRALEDIKESIKELQYYRTAIFKKL
eukprot:Seg543.7 transcript_id=Seg543.7/GoldUCD/mRNA.D3Y31 product="Oligoribonuclease mitochondrial" protein_id=Seg543.7/GoldUCD/D3Y31